MARRDVPDDLRFVPREPVQWLAPRELTAAGLRVALSGAFGEYADKRELEELFGADTFGPDDPPTEAWVDYVADLGDGFDATYSIARLIAAPTLSVAGDDGASYDLPRAGTVVMGGDQVYPTASITEYQDRLVGPYEHALRTTEPPHPHLFAIPGNHDWYDGLTSFVRLFCARQWLGGWELPQQRSYFAVQLTPEWWLWGIDIQFDGYIDHYQIKYFEGAAAELSDGAGVILCSAKPAWARAAHDESVPTATMRNLDFFVKSCLPDRRRVRLQLAGDWHHYARYVEDATGQHYVTSGGGGAYTSATHHLASDVTLRRRAPEPGAPDESKLRLQPVRYPTSAWSSGRRLYGFLAGWWNRTFAYLVGALYLLLGVIALSGRRSTTSFAERVESLRPRDAFEAYWTGLVSSPFGWVLVAVVGGGLIGLTAFGKLPHPWKGITAGALHGAVHLVVASVCVWAAVYVVSWFDDPTDLLTWIVWSAVVFVTGTAIGSAVFGAYLGIADVFGINTNELFAAQRLEGHKQFLRMRVTDDEIEVFVVGFDECPRWEIDTSDTTAAADRIRRSDPDAASTRPRLIEHFRIGRELS